MTQELDCQQYFFENSDATEHEDATKENKDNGCHDEEAFEESSPEDPHPVFTISDDTSEFYSSSDTHAADQLDKYEMGFFDETECTSEDIFRSQLHRW